MNKAANILIVEDEFLGRVYLKNKIIELGHEVIGEAKNTSEAIAILEEKDVDIAIVDINLGEGEKNGIWLGKYISDNYKIPFIYLTAYNTSTMIKNAVESAPSSYLTKPFKIAELEASIIIAFGKVKKYSDIIKIKHDNFFINLNVADIDFVESNGNYLKIFVGEELYQYRCTLKKMKKKLDPDIFVQSHRAFFVNKQKIEKFSATHLTINDTEIPISSNFKDNFM